MVSCELYSCKSCLFLNSCKPQSPKIPSTCKIWENPCKKRISHINLVDNVKICLLTLLLFTILTGIGFGIIWMFSIFGFVTVILMLVLLVVMIR